MDVSSNVAIFWDYENCALPATEPFYAIVNNIRRLAHQHGSVKTFKAYLQYPEQTSTKSIGLRSELQSCGVSLIDCPHNGRKDVADKMMMVDMMAHAIDNPAPATIILISGDRDFVYAVSILGLRQYRVILLAPKGATGGLTAQADLVYSWPDDFLPALPAIAQPTAPVPKPQTVPTPPPQVAPARAPSQSGQKRKMSTSVQTTLRDIWQKQSSIVPPGVTHTTQAQLPPTPVPTDPNPFAVLATDAVNLPLAEVSVSDMSVDPEGSLAPQATFAPVPGHSSTRSLTPCDALRMSSSTLVRSHRTINKWPRPLRMRRKRERSGKRLRRYPLLRRHYTPPGVYFRPRLLLQRRSHHRLLLPSPGVYLVLSLAAPRCTV
ncbi:NYN domain-containing protein [Trametes meyenii]|nr:NYN domain-containing protein [Trametes meyenii]